MNPFKLFKDHEEATKAGAKEEDLIDISWRTEAERDALTLAVQHGNRRTRRHRFDGMDRPMYPLTRTERDRRNARRRVAKKSRKKNGGR